MNKRGWLVIALVALVVVALVVWGLTRTGQSGDQPTASSGTAAMPSAEIAEQVPITASATAAVAGAAATPPDISTVPTETIVILHTNDFHGAVEPEIHSNGAQTGGLVNLVSLIDQLRAEDPEHTLLLDAGDTFQGTYVSNSTYGEVVMDAMNIAGYDAWTLGNHEFDWGQEPLRARIAQAEFPALGANVLDLSTGKVWDVVQPYTVVEVGRARVAILGLAYPDTPAITKPQNVAGLDFSGAEETVDRYLPELEEKADLIVVLSHAGFDGDVALAQAVDGVDVIIGGHSHLFMEWPKKVGDTIVFQAGANGEVLGRLELTLDLRTGEVVDYVRRPALRQVTNDLAVVNREVKDLVDTALAQAAEMMNQPIGETVAALSTRSAGEFALGNLVVDAMLATNIDGRPADIALHNNGGIRADLPQGPITYGQLYAVLPFDNQLMALDLTGAQVLEILEDSVSQSPGALQVAGLAFRFNMAQPPGQRVLEATVGGEPLEVGRVYRVVTIDYLAAGGSGFETFLEGTNVGYGDPEVWVVAEYIRANSPVNPQVEGRIVAR